MGLKNFFKGIKEAWDEEQAIMEEEDRVRKEEERIAQERLASVPKEEITKLEEFRLYNVIVNYASPKDMADYFDYRKGILENLKHKKQDAILFNNLMLTEDFIFDIGHKDIMVKTEDIWAVEIAEPLEEVVKDAVYEIYILTKNPVIPYFRTIAIINIDYDIKRQMSQFCELMVSYFPNLRYGKVTTNEELVKEIKKDEKYPSFKEQANAVKAANEPYKMLGVTFMYETFEEKKPEVFEWLKSYGYEIYIYHQERKTTAKDKKANMVKKVFRAVDFTATTIGVVTGGVSLDNAMRSWDMRHMN